MERPLAHPVRLDRAAVFDNTAWFVLCGILHFGTIAPWKVNRRTRPHWPWPFVAANGQGDVAEYK